MYCPYGNARCAYEDRCSCCSRTCHCGHTSSRQYAVNSWTLTGGRNDTESSEERESSTDESLLFQMDDVDSLPEDSASTSTKPKTKASAGCSQNFPNAISSNSLESQINENPSVKTRSERNYSEHVSKPEALRITEIPIIRDLTICSEPNSVSKHRESRVMKVPTVKDHPECSQPTILDPPACSELNPDDTELLKLEESENVSVSSSSYVYSSESLPSGLSEDSPSSNYSGSSQTISTSAPPVFDLPQPFHEAGSSKEKSDMQSSSDRDSTFDLVCSSTLRISDSHTTDRLRTLSKSSSSIGALYADLLPELSASEQDCQPPSITPKSFYSFSSSAMSISLSPVEATAIEHETSETSPTLNSAKPSIVEISMSERQKTYSESSSSIETLYMEPIPKKFVGEPTDIYFKNENLPEE